MTIEEAIKILEQVRMCYLGGIVEAINMAIDALKSQNTEDRRYYEMSVEMSEYCERYEPTYNPEDGSM